MSPPRIVSVFGATGLQGGCVVDVLLKDGTFIPRAITRDPDSEVSKKLRARGVEVVKADAVDKASLVAALRGSEAVFAVTMPVFSTTEGKGEDEQGKNMIDAAKEVGVKFYIWSSLPSLSKITGGKYKNAVHFEGEPKQIIHDYLKSSGLAHASLLLPGFLENLWNHGMMKKTITGYTIATQSLNATSAQDFVWVSRDVPPAALTLLKNYADPAKQVDGKTYSIVSARISLGKLAELTAKALGVEVTHTTASPTGLLPVDEAWKAMAEFGWYTADTPVPNPDLVALGAKFSTVEDFLETEVKPRFGN
ncbi:hypothetical protein C8R45DRAFT_1193692 [Mycena sanguinolenta]|nr:hypothetical protein C8R45DRAFT_1193692 [Mycena sanguinolenta]